jgi:hypothetical protein
LLAGELFVGKHPVLSPVHVHDHLRLVDGWSQVIKTEAGRHLGRGLRPELQDLVGDVAVEVRIVLGHLLQDVLDPAGIQRRSIVIRTKLGRDDAVEDQSPWSGDHYPLSAGAL